MSDYDTLHALGLADRGDLFGEPDPEPLPAAPVTPPTLEGGLPFPEPGIYFGMPEETYHAIHAASTSGLKRLAVSSMDYWADSVLNPDRDEDKVQRDYFDFGKAIHCLVLEGEDCYAERYVIGLDKGAFPNLLETTEQIKEALVSVGERPLTKTDEGRSAKKEDWIAQLLEVVPDAPIWERIKADFDAEHEGAAIISHKIDRRVKIAARMILAQPDIAENFRDGQAEVSVFWYCRATGCPMKARFDYITMRRIIDLKSFGNRQGLPIDRAIERTIANLRYVVQQVVYEEAAAEAKALILATNGHIYGDGTSGVVDPKHVYWALEWAKQPEPEFMFVFQQSGNAPVTRGKIMPRENMGHYGVTRRRVEELKRVFIANCEVYGTEPWLDIRPVEHIDDSEIPVWGSEI